MTCASPFRGRWFSPPEFHTCCPQELGIFRLPCIYSCIYSTNKVQKVPCPEAYLVTGAVAVDIVRNDGGWRPDILIYVCPWL
uniref:Uncharacterized protein n=1 Tax=Steinernema glaseri TaxID=37863 RepID=A0A1I7ZDJ5_9BILA